MGINKTVFYNTIGSLILYSITFVSAPIFSRLLGDYNYGIVQTYLTILSIITIIIGFGTDGTIPIVKMKITKEKEDEYQSSIMCISFLIFVFVFVLFLIESKWLVSKLGIDRMYVILLPVHAFFNYCINFASIRFIYKLQANYNLFLSVFVATLNFGISFALLHIFPACLYGSRIIGIAVSVIAPGIVMYIYIMYKGKELFEKSYWSYCLSICIPLLFHNLSAIVNEYIDRLMVLKMMDYSSVGIYTLAYNFAAIMTTIWTILNRSWCPFFYKMYAENDTEGIIKKSKNYIYLFTGLTMGFILVEPEVYRVFAHRMYWDGENVIPFVVLSAYFTFLYSFAVNYELAMSKTGFVAIGTLIAALTNIIANILLIPRYGYIGASIATLISSVVLSVVHFVFAMFLVKNKWVIKLSLLVLGTILIIITIIINYIELIWYVRWIMGALIGIIMLRHIVREKSIF